ncbi:CocE/NonD family hydrolase [Nocardiopsis suaedae]|uniref:CocE/NonD family hydrolase n=1 Tax=Nocardiopsis suaedae TaxID=3018444 RepID=A0ABT4TP54_9ACTN|nr:CocE/NonD family hydrolase [Nocardiopsis suaedae]MDA2806059.1 CocE/NonD family hydrolase [Nocardiopsis suaedae]
MPDGTLLRGRWWQAAGEARGLVLIRTPYGADRHAPTARSWSARGYHCLVQDVRGRYRSEGEWSPYAHEHRDGGRVLDLITAEHPGLPVVLYGASYAAHAALEAARAAAGPGPVAAVIALVPALGLAETAWDADGRPQVRHRIGWWHEHGRTRRPELPLSPDELDQRTAQAREHGVIEAADHWGWTPEARAAWRRLWTAPPLDLSARYSRVTVPLLVISGDEDFFHHDAQRLAGAWNAPSHFASGPWGHLLVGGIADGELRARIAGAGGLKHIIDPWLSAHGLPGAPAEWTGILASALASAPPGALRTRSLLDPVSGAWRHERAAHA